MFKLSFRSIHILILLLGLAGSASSFFAQYVLLLDPCPLCILQRVALLAVTLTAILAFFMPSAPRYWQVIKTVWIGVPTLYGAGVALYQIWLQSLPLHERPSCGAPWSFRLRDWWGFDYWSFVVQGLGDCGQREWILGLPLPVWSLLFFSGILVLLVWSVWQIGRHKP